MKAGGNAGLGGAGGFRLNISVGANAVENAQKF